MLLSSDSVIRSTPFLKTISNLRFLLGRNPVLTWVLLFLDRMHHFFPPKDLFFRAVSALFFIFHQASFPWTQFSLANHFIFLPSHPTSALYLCAILQSMQALFCSSLELWWAPRKFSVFSFAFTLRNFQSFLFWGFIVWARKGYECPPCQSAIFVAKNHTCQQFTFGAGFRWTRVKFASLEFLFLA